jgi:hypothetical protein
MIFKLKNRKVEVDQVGGTIDEPMIESAYYIDGDEEELTEEELDVLQDRYMDELSQYLSEKYTDDVFDRMTER